MVGPTNQTPVRVATRHATMQQQWGMAMAEALIACDDSVRRLVDARRWERGVFLPMRVDGRGALPDLRATHYCRVA